MPYPSPPSPFQPWPTHTHNFYMEASRDPAEEPAVWRKDRQSGRMVMIGVRDDQPVGVDNSMDKCIYLTKAKKSACWMRSARTFSGSPEQRKPSPSHQDPFCGRNSRERVPTMSSAVASWTNRCFAVIPEEYDNPGFLPEVRCWVG